MSAKKKELNLTIEIPEINPEIFEKNIIDGIPMFNKELKCKSPYEFWHENNQLEIKRKTNQDSNSPNKKIKQ